MQRHMKDPPTLLMWDPRMRYDKKLLDPNYLWKEWAHESPFHQAIHKFIYHWHQKGEPMFHIDFHGKMNRRSNLNLDVGSVAFSEEHWDTNRRMYNKVIKMTKNELKKSICNNVTYYTKYGQFKFDINMDPYLCGCWVDGQMTMVQQTAQLGLPSIQFEIPLKMRKELTQNKRLLDNFADSIYNIYKVVKE